MVRAASLSIDGLPISKVPVASWAPLEKSSAASGSLHVLPRQARDDAPRQLVEDAGADAHRPEGLLARDERRGHGIGEVEAGAVDPGLLDARRHLQAQPSRHLQLLEPEGGNRLRAVGVEQRIALEAPRLHLAVAELGADRAAKLAERRLHRLVLGLDAALGLPVDEARADLRRAVLEAHLVVGVARGAEPEPHRLESQGVEPPFALRLHLVSLGHRARGGDDDARQLGLRPGLLACHRAGSHRARHQRSTHTKRYHCHAPGR
jgi:hypothetical protein